MDESGGLEVYFTDWYGKLYGFNVFIYIISAIWFIYIISAI